MPDAIRLGQIVAEVLGLPQEETEHASYGVTAAWDSVAHLSLMSTIEERFGIELEAADVSEMSDYTSVRRVLAERYGVDVDD